MKVKKLTSKDWVISVFVLVGFILYFKAIFSGEGTFSLTAIYGIVSFLIAWLISLEQKIYKIKNETRKI